MIFRAIIGVDHVAGAAAAGAVIAGLIVRAGKRKQRIEEAGLLKSQEDRICAKLRSESPFAQLDRGLARVVVQVRISDFRSLSPATFKYAEHISRLRNLPALQGFERRQNSFLLDFLQGRWRRCDQALRLSVGPVAFPKMRRLQRESA